MLKINESIDKKVMFLHQEINKPIEDHPIHLSNRYALGAGGSS